MAKKTWLKSEYAFFQSYSRLFLQLSNVGEISRDHIQARKRHIKFRRRLFTSSIKRKIKQFHVEVEQKQQSGRRSVMHYNRLFLMLLALPSRRRILNFLLL